MNRNVLAFMVLFVPLATQAGGLVLNDLKAQNATQLSKDELAQLMPNAKVGSDFRGSSRSWKNQPNGKLVAHSDARRDPTKLGKQVVGQGSWHLGDNGTYCVMLEWPKRTENWCKYIFKTDGRYYGVKSLNDGAAEANEFSFSN